MNSGAPSPGAPDVHSAPTMEPKVALDFFLLFILFLLVVGPLAVYAGADSRIDEVARRKRLGSG